MTKKLTPAQLKASKRHKAQKRAEQARRDKRISRELHKAEKKALEAAKKLEKSKAKGKTLARQQMAVAARMRESVALRESSGRKQTKATKSIWEKALSMPSILANWLAIDAIDATPDDQLPSYTATHTTKRLRAGYRTITALQVLPHFAPMLPSEIGVTPRGIEVENALLALQPVINKLTGYDDAVGMDFAITQSINYDDGHSTKHFSFQESAASDAIAIFIDKLKALPHDRDYAGIEVVFPLNLPIFIRE